MIKKLPTIWFNKGNVQKFCIFIFFIVLFSPSPSFAQESIGTAIGITINEKNIKDGSLISSTKEGYKLSRTPYEPFLFGVVVLNPALYFEDENNPKAIPVITSGKAKLLVSTKNGAIKKGDYITSSDIPGVGQKATENGTVLGTAEENYTENDPQKYGLVLVTLHPHFAQVTNDITRNLLKAGAMGATAAFHTPLGALRYIVAGFIVLISFFLGFRFFGRASHSGVEAIGRNPLAGKLILFSVGMNVAITIGVMLFGVAIAYLILVL